MASMAASDSEHVASGPPDISDTSLRLKHDSSTQHGHLRGRLGSLGRWVRAAAAVTVVVAALSAVLLGRAGLFTTTASAGSGSGGAPTSWQLYHDPFGLFTLRVPPGWTAQVAPGGATYGDRSSSVTVSGEIVNFDDSSQGTGSALFWIDAKSIKTASDRQVFCQQPSTLQSFSPRTLSSMEQTGATWPFTTDNASFEIAVTIPGVLAPEGYPGPYSPPTATPLPATWVATDKSEVNGMLVSFRPTDPKPLTC